MNTRDDQSSHMLILISYTILAVALIGESFLLGWEKWPLVLIAASIIICWTLHIRRTLTDMQRLWAYTLMMMGSFFFYGIHMTSTFDIAVVMTILIMIFTTTGEPKLIRTAMITYYITMAFDIVGLTRDGTVWDGLMVTRTVFHICMLSLAGWLGMVIIRRWDGLFHHSDERIADLNESAHRMNTFVANLSHELRTPVNAILGITDIMLEKEENEEIRSGMETVRDAGHRLEKQTDDMMDYSELMTAGLAVNAASISLPSFLNDLLSAVRPFIPDDLELVLDVDPEIPAVLVTDPDKLKKIFQHLILNSLTYTKEGGVYVHVSAVPQAYGINLILEVNDTGVGMTESELESIFGQFYQADSGRRLRSGGLGIGLAIVNGFTRVLGGFMVIKSEAGKGTAVTVSIPMEAEDRVAGMEEGIRGDVVLGGYLNYLKYSNPQVREYYNALLKNIVQNLGMPLHRVDNPEDLRKLADTLELTHLLVGEEEYRSDPALIEELAERMVVAVLVRDASVIPPGSRVRIVPKPFHYYLALNIINMTAGDSLRLESKLVCRGVRALIVDDEPMNLQVADAILQRYGMEVTTAVTGQEAVDLCRESAFDIIFMDYMMPEMDGLEAMRQIRMETGGKNSYVPVVMLTANTLSTAREMFFHAGIDGFIGKPIEISELERVLKRVLPASAVRYEAAEENAENRRNSESAVMQSAEAESAQNSETPGMRSAESETALNTETPEVTGISGLNLKEGLRYCQGDEAFYQELLAQYALEAAGREEELRRYYESGDYNGYTIVIHALKSTSKMIGADALSEMARRLEEAAGKADAETVRSLHADFLKAYHSLTEDIASLQTGEEQAQEDYEILEFMPE